MPDSWQNALRVIEAARTDGPAASSDTHSRWPAGRTRVRTHRAVARLVQDSTQTRPNGLLILSFGGAFPGGLADSLSWRVTKERLDVLRRADVFSSKNKAAQWYRKRARPSRYYCQSSVGVMGDGH